MSRGYWTTKFQYACLLYHEHYRKGVCNFKPSGNPIVTGQYASFDDINVYINYRTNKIWFTVPRQASRSPCMLPATEILGSGRRILLYLRGTGVVAIRVFGSLYIIGDNTTPCIWLVLCEHGCPGWQVVYRFVRVWR